jgi:hypothetical protein
MIHEYIVNLHMHTPYSDGSGSHEEIAMAAIQAQIDVVIVTDHNVWVQGPEGYYHKEDKKVLLLVGEEVHDRTRDPQKNHLLIFGVDREMSSYAENPQQLIDKAAELGGVTFIAHPYDPEALNFNEPDLSWVNWDVSGFTGIELWNAMSEFKSLLKNKLHAVYYAFNPDRIGHGPFPEVLAIWDEITGTGKRAVAVAGSDAHQMNARLGPLKRILFPYEFHFRAVNTHIFTDNALTGNAVQDRREVLDALRKGHAFVAYDLPSPTYGFRFSAQGLGKTAWMGDEIPAENGVTLQIRLPQRTECSLIRNGKVLQTWTDRDVASYITTEPGVYRVEAYLTYRKKRRGWIFSNPIYLR